MQAGVMNRSTRTFKGARFETSRRVIDPGNSLHIWSTLDEPLTQEQFEGAETGDTPIFFGVASTIGMPSVIGEGLTFGSSTVRV